jgi:hypothetical protein
MKYKTLQQQPQTDTMCQHDTPLDSKERDYLQSSLSMAIMTHTTQWKYWWSLIIGTHAIRLGEAGTVFPGKHMPPGELAI